MLYGMASLQKCVFILFQVQGATAPVTRAPYAIPVCTRPHVPICTTGHIPVCATTQPTWSFPACSVQLPTCSIQHIPACSMPQVPLTSHPLPPMFSHSHPTPQTSLPQHHSHHRVPPTQFNITPAHQVNDKINAYYICHKYSGS